MQVSRGNILKTTGMLCNPIFVHSRILVFWSELYIFPLPTHIFTKMVKQEMPASIQQS